MKMKRNKNAPGMLKAFIALMRPNAWFATFFSISIGAILALYPSRPAFGEIEEVVVLCVSLGCFIASGLYVLNDIFDAELDRKNPLKKKRPIASGIISVKQALAFSIVLLAFGLLLTLWLSVFHFFLGLLLVFLQLVYSVPPLRLKETRVDLLFSGPINHIVRIVAAWILFKPLEQIPLVVLAGMFLLYCTTYAYYKLIDKKFIPQKSIIKRKQIIPMLNLLSGAGLLLVIIAVLIGEIPAMFISLPAFLIAVWALQLIIPATKKIPFFKTLTYTYGSVGLAFGTMALWALAVLF